MIGLGDLFMILLLSLFLLWSVFCFYLGTTYDDNTYHNVVHQGKIDQLNVIIENQKVHILSMERIIKKYT
jgi:hypothetical protein